jgi:flavodoxin
MKIGIIIYSRTNNTFSVARELEERFVKLNHETSLLHISAKDDNQRSSKNVQLADSPDITPFDVLIFASPVHAFNLSPIMQAYLNQLPTLEDKIVAGFVTQAFPFAFMGGNQAIASLKALVQLKSATLVKELIINWFPRKKRKKAIEETISTLLKVVS